MMVCDMQVLKCYRGIDENNADSIFWVGQRYGNDVKVSSISYHQPQGDGDAHYCDIFYTDDTVVRMFRPDYVEFTRL